MMIEFIKGRLPWRDAKNPQEVQGFKIRHPLESLTLEPQLLIIAAHLNHLR